MPLGQLTRFTPAPAATCVTLLTVGATCTECSQAITGPDTDPDPAASAPRWQPDAHLVPAILAGAPVRMADLPENDRCWAVAGQIVAGVKAEDIAARMRCSLRLVRSIAALPQTQAFLYAQTETQTWINESHLAKSALKVAESRARTAEEELARTREKLSRLIDAHITGTPSCRRCGTPWDRGNTYFEGTKRRCRNCNRIKQAEFRARRRAQQQAADRNHPVGYGNTAEVIDAAFDVAYDEVDLDRPEPAMDEYLLGAPDNDIDPELRLLARGRSDSSGQ